MSNLGCADEEVGEGRSDRERSSIPSADTEAGIRRVCGLWRGSVVALLKPLATGK